MTNKITEALKLAEKMAKRHGVRMCDENGDTHGEELYCVGIDDIADIIREALADHIADAGKVIAEPVKQEPVAWLIPGSITGDKKLAEANGDYATPLYAAPVSAKREWVDLTDDEKGKVWGDWYVSGFYNEELIDRAITAFKEKNK